MNFNMFTAAGNTAVGHLVEVAALSSDRAVAFSDLEAQLFALSRVSAFKEAMDTAVRDAAWDALAASVAPDWIFRSRRNKVDTAD
jgi:hypothetical protein